MQYQFCSNCGARLNQGTAFQAQQCGTCQSWHFHNSKPCAGVLVIQDGKVLLAQRGVEPFKGYWDIPGGFLEAGEHPEAGAIRELLEETGLHIRLNGLLGIYMDRYGSGGEWTLTFYYLAEIVSGSLHVMDDVSALEWFMPEELPQELAFKHQAQVMKDLKEWGERNGFSRSQDPG